MFTTDDAIRHNGKLKDDPHGQRQWLAVANSVMEKCMADGGDDASCAPGAIRQANGVVAANSMSVHWGTAKNYTVREETFQGKPHLVVPAVMMVQGVHRGSHGPIYHGADQLGRFPEAWNNIPVVVNHPEVDGTNVSAGSPRIMEEYAVGRVFNTQMDGQKLKSELWLDPEALARISPDALAYIKAGKAMDVSVGVFTDEDMVTGEWNGERYDAVASNHRPDHLALLPVNPDGTGGVGACSWADGCGLRTHGKGWSDKAREAAAEARARNRGPKPADKTSMAGKVSDMADQTTAWAEEKGTSDAFKSAAQAHEDAAKANTADGNDLQASWHKAQAEELLKKADALKVHKENNMQTDANPNHDDKGRFASGGDHGGGNAENKNAALKASAKAIKASNEAPLMGGSKSAQIHRDVAAAHREAAIANRQAGDTKGEQFHTKMATQHSAIAGVAEKIGEKKSWVTVPFKGATFSEENNMQSNQVGRLKYSGVESTAWNAPAFQDFGMEGNWKDLSDADRAKVAAHFLIGSSKAGSYADLKLPVVNPKTGRLNEFALRACLGGHGAMTLGDTPQADKVNALRMAYRLLNTEFDAGLNVPPAVQEELKAMARMGLQVNDMGYQELAGAIQAKLDSMDNNVKSHFLTDCFDGYFIYRVEPRGGSQVPKGFFKQEYSVADDGTVEFTGEPTPVIKRVTYDPASNTGGMQNMSDKKKPCCAEKVQMLIESGLYQEGDRDRLMTMEEADIDVLAASADNKAAMQAKIDEMDKEMKAMKDKMATMQANGAQEDGKATKELQTLKESLGDQDKLMGILPPQTKAVISHSLRLYEADRARKITHILANAAEGVYTKEVLEAMDDQGLDMLARAFKAPQDYSPLGPSIEANKGNGGPQGYQDQALYPPEVKVA